MQSAQECFMDMAKLHEFKKASGRRIMEESWQWEINQNLGRQVDPLKL